MREEKKLKDNQGKEVNIMEQDFNDVVSALLKVLTWRTHLVVQ